MKKHFITIFNLILSLTFFISCETEPIDPAILNQLTPQNTDCISPSITSGVFSNSTSIILNWTSSSGVSSWQIQFGLKDFSLGNGTIIASDSTTKLVTGLTSANSYDFWIRSVCGSQEFGSWIGPFTVEAPNTNCPNPSGLTAVRNTNNTSAILNWTSGGSETQWEINYVTAGSLISQGTITTATTKPFTVSGLTTQGYDFYVRAKCSTIENSGWVGPITIQEVTTVPTGVAGTYKLTAFNTSPATDLNLDGTASSNQLQETSCFNNMLLILNSNNTFIANSKGVDIDLTANTLTCFTDPDEQGTWSISGNIVTLTYPGTVPLETFQFTLSGTTLTSESLDADIISSNLGIFAYIPSTSAIFVYTKQ